MADLLIQLAVWLIGAFIGVVWEPKSLEWAQWQKRGVWFGLLALGSIATAVAVAWTTDGSPWLWPLLIAGVLLLIVFMVIGNLCRHYHEMKSPPP